MQRLELDDYLEFFHATVARTESLEPSYNVAPTDQIYAAVEHEDSRIVGSFRWGLIPHYAKDRKTIHINARSESVATKPAFRDSFARRRCLIPADGFYEWQRHEDGTKQPFFITEQTGPMAFAGLWTRWRDPATEERVLTCTIITTAASEAVEPVHGRMPVALQPDLWDDWLDVGERDPETLQHLLNTAAEGTLSLQPVSTLVNSVRNNGPELIDAH